MRLLVLGGQGMLGRAVVREARRRDWPTLGLSRSQGDVTDPEALRRAAEAFRPRVVANCAAFTRVDDCETRREHALEVNGRAVGKVAEAARGVGARLLQVSSDYVFDGRGQEPYPEDAVTGPLSVYGESKLRGEEAALAVPGSLVVRASWLFGPGGPNFVRTLVDLLRGGREELRVVDDQVGAPTYTPFLARALCDLAALEAEGVIHYRNRDPVSWYGFAREIARGWDPRVRVRPVTTDEFPRPAVRPAYSVLEVRRFESLAGRLVESWAGGLASYLETLR